MKLQLILLAEPILVSDETPNKFHEGYYFLDGKVYHTSKVMLQSGCKKIIAGVPELPLISYSDEAREVLEKKYGWVNLEKLFEMRYGIPLNGSAISRYEGFIDGFKFCQSLKKFSEEDMLAFGEFMQQRHTGVKESFEYFCKLVLSQPKVIDVEVEMGLMRLNSDGVEIGFPDMSQPKITNNSIKVIKIL